MIILSLRNPKRKTFNAIEAAINKACDELDKMNFSGNINNKYGSKTPTEETKRIMGKLFTENLVPPNAEDKKTQPDLFGYARFAKELPLPSMDKVKQLLTHLDSNSTRVISIVGISGSGKTLLFDAVAQNEKHMLIYACNLQSLKTIFSLRPSWFIKHKSSNSSEDRFEAHSQMRKWTDLIAGLYYYVSARLLNHLLKKEPGMLSSTFKAFSMNGGKGIKETCLASVFDAVQDFICTYKTLDLPEVASRIQVLAGKLQKWRTAWNASLDQQLSARNLKLVYGIDELHDCQYHKGEIMFQDTSVSDAFQRDPATNELSNSLGKFGSTLTSLMSTCPEESTLVLSDTMFTQLDFDLAVSASQKDFYVTLTTCTPTWEPEDVEKCIFFFLNIKGQKLQLQAKKIAQLLRGRARNTTRFIDAVRTECKQSGHPPQTEEEAVAILQKACNSRKDELLAEFHRDIKSFLAVDAAESKSVQVNNQGAVRSAASVDLSDPPTTLLPRSVLARRLAIRGSVLINADQESLYNTIMKQGIAFVNKKQSQGPHRLMLFCNEYWMKYQLFQTLLHNAQHRKDSQLVKEVQEWIRFEMSVDGTNDGACVEGLFGLVLVLVTDQYGGKPITDIPMFNSLRGTFLDCYTLNVRAFTWCHESTSYINAMFSCQITTMAYMPPQQRKSDIALLMECIPGSAEHRKHGDHTIPLLVGSKAVKSPTDELMQDNLWSTDFRHQFLNPDGKVVVGADSKRTEWLNTIRSSLVVQRSFRIQFVYAAKSSEEFPLIQDNGEDVIFLLNQENERFNTLLDSIGLLCLLKKWCGLPEKQTSEEPVISENSAAAPEAPTQFQQSD